MLNDENLVEKEGMVDANVNDTIDGNCFVCCPPPLKMTGSPKKKIIIIIIIMKGEKELGKQKRTCGFCKKSQI